MSEAGHGRGSHARDHAIGGADDETDVPEAPWRRPAPSRATRRIGRASKGSARSRMVGPDRRVRVCEGNLEKRVFCVLLARPDVRDLREQPEAVTYLDRTGRARRHTFDAVVDLHDGTRLAVMVKRAEVAARVATRHLAALLAAQLAAEVADGVILMTEDDAGPDAMHDARLINGARLHPEPGHDRVLRAFILGMAGEATIAEIRRDSGLGGHAVRAVARALHAGELVKVSPGRIAASTAVRRASVGEAGA